MQEIVFLRDCYAFYNYKTRCCQWCKNFLDNWDLEEFSSNQIVEAELVGLDELIKGEDYDFIS